MHDKATTIFDVTRQFVVGLALINVLMTCTTAVAQTLTFTVNKTADTLDTNPGDGICDDRSRLLLGLRDLVERIVNVFKTGECPTVHDPAPSCSLRAAIMESNSLTGPQDIEVPAGTYTLTQRIGGTHSELSVYDFVNIHGAGPGKTIIDANFTDRAIGIYRPTELKVLKVYLEGVTVENGAHAIWGRYIQYVGYPRSYEYYRPAQCG